jgi:hypothetical protein
VTSKQRLLNCKLAARARDQFMGGGILQELEAEAKSISLPRHRENFHFAQREGEFEPNHFALGRLFAKYGSDSRFADIDRVALDYAPIAGVDLDRYLQLVARMSPVFDKPWNWIARPMLGSHFHTFDVICLVKPSGKKSPDTCFNRQSALAALIRLFAMISHFTYPSRLFFQRLAETLCLK